jgi:hypothetical protein
MTWIFPFADFESDFFWKWTDFQSYVEFTMCFVSVGSLIMYLLIKFDPFVEAVGFMAVFTEAMLGTPQFYRNYANKSTYGMRYSIIKNFLTTYMA